MPAAALLSFCRPSRLPRLCAQVEALALARLVCGATATFPAAHAAAGEHLRHAASSVPARVAEACARSGPRAGRADRAWRIAAAWDALGDLEARLDLAAAAGLVPADRAAEIARHCRWTGRLLHALAHGPAR